MTILTAKLTERKENITPPEVVADYTFLIQNDKNEIAAKLPKDSVIVNMTPMQLRRKSRSFWVSLAVVFILASLILGCVCLYNNLLNAHEVYYGRCGVRYRDAQLLNSYVDSLKANGEFQQEVEIGNDDYEKIIVPTIGDTRSATILHDFNVNYTVIIEKEKERCFLLPLNRSLVLPPRDLLDLIMKLKNGYYVPDTNVVRENYRVVSPPIRDFSDYGLYIAVECHNFDSYRLVREGEPLAMSKRAVCEFAGSKYSLGDAGTDKLLFLNIVGCV